MSSRKKHKVSPDENRFEPEVTACHPEDALSREVIKESMVWICTILCTLAVYAIVAVVIKNVYKPDLAPMIAKGNELLIVADSVYPEPVESLLTRVGIVVMGLGLWGFYVLYSKMTALKQIAQRPLFMIAGSICAIAIVALIYADMSALNPFGAGTENHPQNNRDLEGGSNFYFYFKGLFLGDNLLLYLVVCVPLLCALFFAGIRQRQWDKTAMYEKLVNGIGYILSASVVIAIVAMNTYRFPYTVENRYNFDAVYYSMTQVYAGSPMLVDGFTNTYGLYPHFLNPLFQIVGLSVLKFSMVMAILVGLSFVFNFYVLRQFTANKVILFLGFAMLLFFPYLDARLVTNFDSFFALYPVRYIVPSVLLVLAGMYLHSGSWRIYWATMVLMVCSVLWNPEIGLVSFLSWLGVNIYAGFYDAEGKPAVKKWLLHVVAGVSALAGTFILYAVVIYLVYGSFPQLSLLFSTMMVFGNLGFNMLPMTLVHPWNMMVLILILGFVYSISKLHKKEIDTKASMVFLLSVLGLGFFLYFQGRSHNWSLAGVSGISIMLLTLLGDELWTKARSIKLPALDMLFAVFLMVISFSVFELVANAASINELVFQDANKIKHAREQEELESNAAFIKNNTAEHERIMLMTTEPEFGIYFDGTKRVSAFNPSFTELFFLAGLQRMEETIKSGPGKVFIEAFSCRFRYILRSMFTLSAIYEVASTHGGISCLQKRRKKIQQQHFFGRTEGMLLHRKYYDDANSVNMRVNDALGIKQIRPDSVFSVSVLFYACPQLCPTSALVTNGRDSTKGFIIEKRTVTGMYYFGVNGHGIETNISEKAWAYCVMNVYSDRIEVYLNGVKIGVAPFPGPYGHSKEVVHIGGQGLNAADYYMGAISEVAVVNGAQSAQEIQAIFGAIRRNTFD